MATDSLAPSASSLGVRVTVWPVFQLLAVKVSLALLLVTAPVSPLVTVTVTFAFGAAVSLTEYAPVLPPSVRLTEVGENVKPRSSSATVAVRLAETSS